MVSVSCFALLLAGVSPAAPAVTVVLKDPLVLVQVDAATTLGDTVDAVCAAADARCDALPPAVRGRKIAPVKLRGNWDEVIDSLLKPTGIAYGTAPGGAGRTPQLFITKPPEEDDFRSEQRTTNSFEATDPASSASSIAESAPENPADTEATPASESDGAPSPAVAPAPEAWTGGAPPERMVTTPFAGPDGKPLTVPVAASPDPNWVTTPFHDDQGAPIVLPRIQDQSGATPFVDPSGQPIYVQPNPNPPAKLEYPIPVHMPTAPAAGSQPPSAPTTSGAFGN